MRTIINGLVVLLLLSACTTATAPVLSTMPSPTTPAQESPQPTASSQPSPSPLPSTPEFKWVSALTEELAHWQEYEAALGHQLLRSIAPDVLCEWQILGRDEQVVYVMAICMGIEPIGQVNPGYPTIRIPAVIRLTDAGSVSDVETPGAGTHYARDIRKLFPAELHDIIFNGTIYETQLHEHLRWRLDHPDQPPLIVLESTLEY